MTGCHAKGCKNTSGNGVKMNFFPKDPQRKAVWINICKKHGATKLPTIHSALCEYHFAAGMWEKPRVDGKKKLKNNAEPTIFGDSVVQMNKRLKDIKLNHCKSFVMCTNPNAKDIQILTQPMVQREYRILLPESQTIVNKKPRNAIRGPTDLCETVKKQLPSFGKKNLSVLLNNNVISCYIGDAASEGCDKTVDVKIWEPKLQSDPQELQKNDKYIPDDNDSETDSFIANNFEPVSDDVIGYEENFEPVTDNDEDYEQIEEENEKDSIDREENHLHSLQREFKSKANEKCKRCEWVEQVYQKSESIRLIMKKKYKQRHRLLKNTIKSLQDKIKVLERNQQGLNKLFNNEQLSILSENKKKVHKWSDITLEKAKKYKLAFGTEGYQFLINNNWPLPSVRTLCKKVLEKKKSGKEYKKISGRANDKTTEIIV